MSANLLRKYSSKAPKSLLMKGINWWGPFRGAGIKVDSVSEDYREIWVSLKLTWFNQNYVGTHFGGSLYAMTDPFYMLTLINNLGPDFIVWDKASSIEFKKPGKGTVKAHFVMTEEEIEDVRSKATELGKYIFDKPVDIKNEQGEVVATVVKTLYVRKKNKAAKSER